MSQVLKTIQLPSDSVDQTVDLGRRLGKTLGAGDVVLLTGDLGAGKTQFSRGVGLGLGINEPITSPTFNIVVEHKSGSLPLYHFDLYRLEFPQQLDDIDYWAMTEGEGASLVEWGDKFNETYIDADLEISIALIDEQTRELTIEAFTARGIELINIFEQASA